MRRALLRSAVIALALPVALTAAPPRQIRAPSSLDRVIEDYRRGDGERALAEFKTWNAKRMAVEYEAWDTRRVEGGRFLPVDSDLRDLAALAMLNTLAAFDLDEFGISRATVAGGQPHYVAALRLVVTLARTRQSVSGSTLSTDEQKRNSEVRAFCRNWYVFATTMWLAARQCLQAEKLASDAIGNLGPDAELFLAAGSVAETKMGPFERGASVESSCGELWGPSELSSHGSWLTHNRYRGNAEDFLDRAVSLDPGLTEAHLRLGRVLYWGDRPGDAERELERAVATTARAERRFVGYLAALFLGQLREEAHRVGEAKRAYEQAITFNPSGRSAHLALGHLLLMSGASDEAWARIRETFTDTTQATSDVDPWLNYRNGQLWRASERVNALEAWVRR